MMFSMQSINIGCVLLAHRHCSLVITKVPLPVKRVEFSCTGFDILPNFDRQAPLEEELRNVIMNSFDMLRTRSKLSVLKKVSMFMMSGLYVKLALPRMH